MVPQKGVKKIRFSELKSRSETLNKFDFIADKKFMKNSNSVFIIFTLTLTIVVMAGYNKFVAYFGEHNEVQIRVVELERELEKAHAENKMLAYQLKDFQQAVAKILPEHHDQLKTYAQQNLADVLRAPASEKVIDLSAALMEKGKSYFLAGKYDRALSEFSKVSEKYPLSPYSVEARFFVAESYFLKADYEKSLSAIGDMVEQYPENVLTGFILLRMGQISQFNEQPAEAKEIFKTVLNSFNDEKLKQQAKKLYEGVVL